MINKKIFIIVLLVSLLIPFLTEASSGREPQKPYWNNASCTSENNGVTCTADFLGEEGVCAGENKCLPKRYLRDATGLFYTRTIDRSVFFSIVRLDFNSPEFGQSQFSTSGTSKAYNWMLSNITTPTGNKYEFEYEIDTWVSSRYDVFSVHDSELDNICRSNHISFVCASLSEDDCKEVADETGWCQPYYDESGLEFEGGDAVFLFCEDNLTNREPYNCDGNNSHTCIDLQEFNYCVWKQFTPEQENYYTKVAVNFGGGIRVKEYTHSTRAGSDITYEYDYSSSTREDIFFKDSSGTLNIVPSATRMHYLEDEGRPLRHMGSPYVRGGVLYNEVSLSIKGEPGRITSYFTTVDSNEENTGGAINFSTQDLSAGVSFMAMELLPGSSQAVRYSPQSPNTGCCEVDLTTTSGVLNDRVYGSLSPSQGEIILGNYPSKLAVSTEDSDSCINDALTNDVAQAWSNFELGRPFQDDQTIVDQIFIPAHCTAIPGFNCESLNQDACNDASPYCQWDDSAGPGSIPSCVKNDDGPSLSCFDMDEEDCDSAPNCEYNDEYTADFDFYIDRFYNPLTNSCEVPDTPQDCQLGVLLSDESDECRCGEFVINPDNLITDLVCVNVAGENQLFNAFNNEGEVAGTSRAWLRGLNYRTLVDHPNYLKDTTRKFDYEEFFRVHFGNSLWRTSDSWDNLRPANRFVVQTDSNLKLKSSGYSIGTAYLTQEKVNITPTLTEYNNIIYSAVSEGFNPVMGMTTKNIVHDYGLLNPSDSSDFNKEPFSYVLETPYKMYEYHDRASLGDNADALRAVLPVTRLIIDGQEYRNTSQEFKEFHGFPRLYKDIVSINNEEQVFTYDYDEQGNLRNVTSPTGLIVYYEHDEFGRNTKMWNSLAGSSSNPLVLKEYNDKGQVIRKTNELGQETQFFYDAYGRQRMIIGPLDSETHPSQIMIYDDTINDGPIKTTIQYKVSGDADSGVYSEVISFTDGNGVPLQTQELIGENTYSVIHNVHDIYGNPLMISNPFHAETNGEYLENVHLNPNFKGWEFQYVYEAGLEGRLIQRIRGDNNLIPNPSFEATIKSDNFAYWNYFSNIDQTDSGVVDYEARSGVRSLRISKPDNNNWGGIESDRFPASLLEEGVTYSFILYAKEAEDYDFTAGDVLKEVRCSPDSTRGTVISSNNFEIGEEWTRSQVSFEFNDNNYETCWVGIHIRPERGDVSFYVDDIILKRGGSERDGMVTYEYSATSSGLPQTIVFDEVGNKRRYTYNIKGDVLRLEEDYTSGTYNVVTSFVYDTLGRLIKVYDPKGRAALEKEYDGKIPAYSESLDSGRVSFTYDIPTSSILQKDFPEVNIEYGYDELGRLTRKHARRKE